MNSVAMDPTALVKKKLGAEERCLICIEAGIVQDWLKSTRYLALVERHKDHAIFIYSSTCVPCFSSTHLILETVLPVERDLKCTAASDFGVSIKSSQGNLLLELPSNSQGGRFLSELEKSRDATLKSNGRPSSFSWLDKYRSASMTSSVNPFAHDVFDPFQLASTSMAQNSPQSSSINDWPSSDIVEPVIRSHPSNPTNPCTNQRNSTFYVRSSYPCTNKPFNGDPPSKNSLPVFEDHFSDSFPPLKKISPAVSRDSLDSILTSSNDASSLDPVQMIQRQLCLAAAKPVTARETFVKHYMADRETEFVDKQTIRVFCGTWNVNGQAPVESLSPWLAVDDEPPDIYAIGFQELDLSKEAFIFSESSREQEWEKSVEIALHLRQKYRKVELVRLVGIMLIVYVRKELMKNLTLVDVDSVPTGIMGIMGNKGGVSVRFTLHNTSFCFVNSHLAAHQEEFERRNQDYRDISSKVKFKSFVPSLMILEHDVIFWIGDLNYRITDLYIDQVKELIVHELYDKLMAFDQLKIQMDEESDIFSGYTEKEISFRPTYKYNPGTDDWDSSEKNRPPAYCDRILWRGEGIQQNMYRSHPKLRVSDHKPVSATFDVTIKVIDTVRHKKVYEDVMKKLDRLENEFLPTVKLDNTEFRFEDVKFIQSQKRILTVANIGQLPVQFEFINKLDEDSFCKPWLTVRPYKEAIMPGYSCEVSFEVYVDKSTVRKLNSGEDRIDDILVLHLHGGKDFFVPVTGTFLPSSFGSSLEALIQIHEPVKEVPVAQLIDLESPGSLQKSSQDSIDGPPFAVPKEIWRLVDHLYKYGIQQKELFQQPGLHPEMEQIRDCLDTGTPQKIPGSVHSIAEALLVFLQSLPQPVIPCNIYTKCLDNYNNFLTCKQILQQIPEYHKNVFKYLCAFLRELVKHSQYNDLDSKMLASLFGETFLRPPSTPIGALPNTGSRPREEEQKRAAFVLMFLTNEYDD